MEHCLISGTWRCSSHNYMSYPSRYWGQSHQCGTFTQKKYSTLFYYSEDTLLLFMSFFLIFNLQGLGFWQLDCSFLSTKLLSFCGIISWSEYLISKLAGLPGCLNFLQSRNISKSNLKSEKVWVKADINSQRFNVCDLERKNSVGGHCCYVCHISLHMQRRFLIAPTAEFPT